MTSRAAPGPLPFAFRNPNRPDVVALVLDAGALIAFEHADPTVLAFLDEAHRRAVPVRTSSGATSQVWRDRARQVRLTRLLRGVEEVAIDKQTRPRIGRLLALSSTVDVVDAAVVDVTVDGDEILTTDPDDLAHLAASAGRRVDIIAIGT